jgi:hypothetical protein
MVSWVNHDTIFLYFEVPWKLGISQVSNQVLYCHIRSFCLNLIINYVRTYLHNFKFYNRIKKLMYDMYFGYLNTGFRHTRTPEQDQHTLQSANAYRELQAIYKDIRVQGFQFTGFACYQVCRLIHIFWKFLLFNVQSYVIKKKNMGNLTLWA